MQFQLFLWLPPKSSPKSFKKEGFNFSCDSSPDLENCRPLVKVNISLKYV